MVVLGDLFHVSAVGVDTVLIAFVIEGGHVEFVNKGNNCPALAFAVTADMLER